MHLYRTHLPALATIGGVQISGGGYGSSFTPDPNRPGVFYGVTDRGPNVDGPNGTRIEPLHAKVLPDGTQDDGEYLAIDTERIDHPVTSATVSITVG